jgi:transglutaminase-like putative cysteine protease
VSLEARNAPSTQRLLWTAAVIVGASLPHWMQTPLWVPALLIVCVAWRLAAATLGWPLPNTVLRLLLALVAFFGVLMEYRTINGLTAGSALLIVMVALKFLESRSQRDQLVLMIIAYFLVFASLLYQRSLLTGAYLLAFVWITTVGLLQLGRRGALSASWPNVKLAGRMLLQAVPIMLVLFVFFPRLPGPLWAIPGTNSSGTSGLSDEMSPGDITALGLSDAVAFRVEFSGNPPSADKLYWRGPVLSNFEGRAWTRARGMRHRAGDTLRFVGGETEYRVMLEPQTDRWAFALDMPQAWSRNRQIVMNSDYQLRLLRFGAADSVLDYTVTSYTDYRAREPLTPSQQDYYRTLPANSNPRTRALVESWLADDPAPEEIIRRALNVFRSGEFYYTLTPPPLGRDAIDEFVFETREGFCEHYASAFTFMMRAAGLPARVVTGYQGGELNSFGKYYIIRQSDAHAWTEVWLGERGWVRVDPTGAVAPERIASGSARRALGSEALSNSGLKNMPWVRTALLALDAVNTYWNTWVLGYGPELQRALLRALGFDRPRWTHLFLLTALSTGTVIIALAAFLAWRSRRRRPGDAAARCYARFTKRLGRANVPPPARGEGPAAYAARAAERVPEARAHIEQIMKTYLAARYEPDTSGEQLTQLRRLVGEFRPRRRAAV